MCLRDFWLLSIYRITLSKKIKCPDYPIYPKYWDTMTPYHRDTLTSYHRDIVTLYHTFLKFEKSVLLPDDLSKVVLDEWQTVRR